MDKKTAILLFVIILLLLVIIAQATNKTASAAVAFQSHRTIDRELSVACYIVYSSDGQLAQSCVNLVDSCFGDGWGDVLQ